MMLIGIKKHRRGAHSCAPAQTVDEKRSRRSKRRGVDAFLDE